jgi:radical SAM protein with 4Fe4S-binding SPASM domain
MGIETLQYGEFAKTIYGKVGDGRKPMNGTIEVTNRCPLDCAHCYNNLPMGDAAARARELTTEEHFRLLDELAEMGCLWILFTGGEIFARRDFLDIYEYASKKGFIITLFTNGTMITEPVADALARRPPFSIEITLYGATRETYEKLTGIPGSYEHCLSGIRHLLERKLPLSLKTVAVSINKHEVAMMKAMAAELGVEFKFDPMINPRIDCSSSPLAVRLTPIEMVELEMEFPERAAEWKRLVDDFGHEVEIKDGEMPPLYECGGGQTSFAIDPYGDLSVCVLSHADRYNVRGGLPEAWERFGEVRTKKLTQLTKCTTCGLRSMCGMCPATAELENLDPETPVDYLCHVAHLRAATLDIPVRPHGECEYCPGGEHYALMHDEATAVQSGSPELIAAVVAAAAVPAPAAAGCGSGCSSCTLH